VNIYSPIYIKYINPIITSQEDTNALIRLVITPPASGSISYYQFLPKPTTIDLNSAGELKIKLANTDNFYINGRYEVKFYFVKPNGKRTDTPFLTQRWKVPSSSFQRTKIVTHPFNLDSMDEPIYEIMSTSLNSDFYIENNTLIFNSPPLANTTFSINYVYALSLGDILDEIE